MNLDEKIETAINWEEPLMMSNMHFRKGKWQRIIRVEDAPNGKLVSPENAPISKFHVNYDGSMRYEETSGCQCGEVKNISNQEEQVEPFDSEFVLSNFIVLLYRHVSLLEKEIYRLNFDAKYPKLTFDNQELPASEYAKGMMFQSSMEYRINEKNKDVVSSLNTIDMIYREAEKIRENLK